MPKQPSSFTFKTGKPYDSSSPHLSLHHDGPASKPPPPPLPCPKCEKPCRRRQELGRHLLTFHLPCSVYCPYSSCPWRGDRREDLKKHLKNQGCGPLNPKREQYEIYEKNVMLYWILNCDEPVEKVARYAVGVVEERALEVGKVKEWDDPWGYEWKTTRHPRNE